MSEPDDRAYNPYSSPRDGEGASAEHGTRSRVPGTQIKWVYAITAAIDAILFLLVRYPTTFGIAADTQHTIVVVLDNGLRWLFLGLAVIWLHQVWTGVPAPARDRRGITPSGAVGRLFLPIFNIYWVFAVNVILCDTVEELLSENGDGRHTPKELAVIATIGYYVPTILLLTSYAEYAFLGGIADHGLWLVYMFQMDDLRQAATAPPADQAADALA